MFSSYCFCFIVVMFHFSYDLSFICCTYWFQKYRMAGIDAPGPSFVNASSRLPNGGGSAGVAATIVGNGSSAGVGLVARAIANVRLLH
jgi:hypothetical protein